MQLSMNIPGLLELFKSFYTLTHLKISIHDDTGALLFSYPQEEGSFCAILNAHPETKEKCAMSTAALCRKCAARRTIVIERCHAGLTEVVAPLLEGEVIIGYVMFGQLTSVKNKDSVFEDIRPYVADYGLDMALLAEQARKIRYKTHDQIIAASEILAALTHYILLKQMISMQREQIQARLLAHIDAHLADTLTVDALCKALYISRSALYTVSKECMKNGIAAYVRGRRIERAKTLLRTTDMPVTAIAAAVGFADYNYFCRVFKRNVGMAARKYAQERAEGR